MSLTWFGWLYTILLILGVMMKIGQVNVRRVATTTAGEAMFSLLWAAFIWWGVFHVGVLH